jgi:hypothetical protein
VVVVVVKMKLIISIHYIPVWAGSRSHGCTDMTVKTRQFLTVYMVNFDISIGEEVLFY